MKATLLLADNSDEFRSSFAKNVLRPEGYTVLEAKTPEEAKALLAANLIHAAIVDVRLVDDNDRSDRSGVALCQEINPLIVRILLTGFPDWPVVRQAMTPTAHGPRIADGFLDKSTTDTMPFKLEELARLLNKRFEIIPSQRIAVLTSGGDSPGMNAAIRAVVRSAMNMGYEVIGVENGYRGLAKGEMYPLRWNDVSDIANRGGTILRSDRYEPFFKEEGRAPAVEHVRKCRISGLIIIGGDGSMQGATKLSEDLSRNGVKISTVAIPATIDNDIAGTDMSLGADSAANAMIHELRDMVAPAQALRRIFVVEVMGAHCGYLALQAAIGVGAEAVIVPEDVLVFNPGNGSLKDRLDLNQTVDRFRAALNDTAKVLRRSFDLGKRYGFVILAEAFKKLAPKTNWLGDTLLYLENEVKSWPDDIRPSVRDQELGYPVRGVAPTRFDVWLGSRMGEIAVQDTKEGLQEQMVSWTEHQGFGQLSFRDVTKATVETPVEKWKNRPTWQKDLETVRSLARLSDE